MLKFKFSQFILLFIFIVNFIFCSIYGIEDLSSNSSYDLLNDVNIEKAADHYSRQLDLKEELSGHYFGIKNGKSIYLVLTPYVYKKFEFNDELNLAEYATPYIGLWNVSEGETKSITLEQISNNFNEVEYIPISINDESLYFESEEIILDKVGVNFVPGLFHFQRMIDHEDNGYIASFDSNGIVSVQHDFPDHKFVFDQEACNLTKLGFCYQYGNAYRWDDSYGFDAEPLILEEGFFKEDKAKALTLYEKAAQMSYPPAMYNLATFYNEGITVDKDVKIAVEWLNAAVNSGHTSSEELLGTILYDGADGVPQDKERAAELWRSAARKGNAMAQYNLGKSLYDNENATKDNLIEAEFWLTAAAGRDVSEAFMDLFYINYFKSDEYLSEEDEYYGILSIQFLYQARYLGNKDAIELVNMLNELYNPDMSGSYNKSESIENDDPSLDSNKFNEPTSIENLLGHYFGTYKNEHGDTEYVYIILQPHVFIKYKLDSFDYEEFQDPLLGTWGIDDTNSKILHLDLRLEEDEKTHEYHLEVLPNRSLKSFHSNYILERTHHNAVPLMFHTHRQLMGDADTRFYENDKLLISKSFSDGKEIYIKDGFELYNKGVFYETGNSKALIVDDEYSLLESDDHPDNTEYQKSEIDLELAFHCYEKSAKMNYPPAMYNLAVFYEFGLGCERNMDKAMQWYNAAAQTGYTAAISMLAEIYLFGTDEIESNDKKAVEYLLEASNNGDRKSQYYLGLCYFYDDYPLDKDLLKAEKLFRLSAAQGYHGGYYQLTWILYEKSKGFEDSILNKEISAYLLTAYDLGNPSAIEMIDGYQSEEN